MKVEENFKPVQGYECLNSCLCNYLNMWGFPIDTSVLFFCGDGFDIRLIDDNDKLKIETNTHKSNYEFMKKYYILYEKFKGENGDMKAHLLKMIKEKRFISLVAVSNSLKYNRVFSQNEANHFINVLEYDANEDKLLIIDGFVPTMKPGLFYGWVDINEIFDGWSRSGFQYIEFWRPETLDCANIYEDYKISVKNQLNKYISQKTSSDNRPYGYVSLIETFNKLVCCDYELLGTVPQDINYQMRIEGVFASRYYIKRAVSLLLDDSEICKKIDDFIAKWDYVSFMLIKSSFSRKKEYLQLISEKVEEIVYDENKLISDIIKRLDNA